MAKHILIHNPKYNCAASIDVERFAECVRKLEDDPRPLVRWPMSWFDTALLAHGHDGLIEVTPRGADLLASIDSLPDDPTPEVKVAPCSKCNGTGEQPLFVSMETCSRCEGSKVEPRETAFVKYNPADVTVTIGAPCDTAGNAMQIAGREWLRESLREAVSRMPYFTAPDFSIPYQTFYTFNCAGKVRLR